MRALKKATARLQPAGTCKTTDTRRARSLVIFFGRLTSALKGGPRANRRSGLTYLCLFFDRLGSRSPNQSSPDSNQCKFTSAGADADASYSHTVHACLRGPAEHSQIRELRDIATLCDRIRTRRITGQRTGQLELDTWAACSGSDRIHRHRNRRLLAGCVSTLRLGCLLTYTPIRRAPASTRYKARHSSAPEASSRV
jgi:hypothetical protein